MLHKSENVTEAPNNCNKSGNLWETGKRFFEYIQKQILENGLTGRVAFDGMGDRMFAEYKVINIKTDPKSNYPRMSEVGQYKYSEVSRQDGNPGQRGSRKWICSVCVCRLVCKRRP